MSSEEIDGERERVDVGVEGDEEFAEEYAEGIKGSLTRYEGGGRGCESVGDGGKNPEPLPRGTPNGDCEYAHWRVGEFDRGPCRRAVGEVGMLARVYLDLNSPKVDTGGREFDLSRGGAYCRGEEV